MASSSATVYASPRGVVNSMISENIAGAGGETRSGFGTNSATKIIQQAIWLYVRFTLSFRDVEDLSAERGIAVSYER